jgi:hypothetical protein
MALLQQDKLPALASVAEMSAEHRIRQWWLGLIAGMDEMWERTPNVNSFADELLRVLLAIDLGAPTSFEDGDGPTKGRAWKIAVFSERPDLVRDAYLATARAGLGLGLSQDGGVHELLNSEALVAFRKDVVIELLRDFPNAPLYRLKTLSRAALADPTSRIEFLPVARDVLARSTVEQDRRDIWLVAAYLASPDEFQEAMQTRITETSDLVWLARDLAGNRPGRADSEPPLRLKDLEFIARSAGRLFPDASHPSVSWSGDANAWDAAEFVRSLVNEISVRPTGEATEILERLAQDGGLASYRDNIRHALANQRVRLRESEYSQPNWAETIAALSNGAPASVSDLHAMLIAHLSDLAERIVTTNTDIYKRFWNEDSYARITNPKREESCRDVLIDLLRTRFDPLRVTIEPEGHMAADQRADISVTLHGKKILVELKKDTHADVWTAVGTQLDRYTRDPEASGFGVYGVLWLGDKRPSSVPKPPSGTVGPSSGVEMEQMLRALLPAEKRTRLHVIVIDVSGSG